MWIEQSAFRENNRPGDWFVDGEIYIKGEFTREEWEAIKTNFIAMGLAQLGGEKLSTIFPRRSEVIDAMMEDARHNNRDAMKRLEARFPALRDRPGQKSDIIDVTGHVISSEQKLLEDDEALNERRREAQREQDSNQ